MGENDTIADLIEKNQYSFIDNCGNYELINVEKNQTYYSIHAPGFVWPNFVYRIQKNSTVVFEEINSKIEQDKLPPFLLFSSIFATRWAEELSLNGYRLIVDWPMMYKKLPLVNSLEISQDVVRITEHNSFAVFSNIASVNLNGNKPYPDNLFSTLFKKCDTDFFIAYKNSEPIGTLLLYYQENAAGVYMVSVDKDYRKQGFARQLMNAAIVRAEKRGCEKMVLQSTPQGLSLYRNMGFIETGLNMQVFWKVGKFF